MENQNGYYNSQNNNQGNAYYGYQAQQNPNGYTRPNGNFNGYNPFQSYVVQKDPFINKEARHITKLSILAGAAILSFLGMQNIMSILLSAFDLYELYLSNYSFQLMFGAINSVVSIFVPFAIIYALYPKGDREKCLEFGEPISWKAFGLAVPAGLMVCFLSDYISSGFSCFVGAFGVSFVDIDTGAPSNIFEFFLMVISWAVVPALVEEFAVRGVIMQPLRRYGDRFAIIMSSVIFAIMHGNMVQIPFALVAGFALGYFAIATNSIWTSVAIHFANNLFSVILTSLNTVSPIKDNDSLSSSITIVLMLSVIAAGVYCLWEFIKTEHKGQGLTTGPKIEKLLFMGASIIFIGFSFLITIFDTVIPIFYMGAAAVTIAFFFIYRTENRKALNLDSANGLTEKLKTSLYLGTPTVILAAYSLLILTIEMVSFENFGSYIFCFLLFVAYYIIFIKALMNVNKSKELENKKAYTVSGFVLAISAVFTMIFLLVLFLR